MPLIAAALAATLSVSATCSWNRPGVDPYRGDTATALAHYPDIPAAQRKVLLDKITAGTPDDRVAIRRDAIVGDGRYDPAIRDMHFGKARMCGTVDRSRWTEARSEPGAVYCADQHCILVPRICGNVSRITRRAKAAPQQPDQPVAVAEPVPIEPWQPGRHPLDWLTGTELGLSDGPGDEGGDSDGADEGDGAGEPRLLAEGGNPALWGWDEDQPVQAVPEASTWAMLLAGAGVVAGWSRRTARKAAART
ncbi:MHFG family PEP-CTERM protein [Pseudoduganella chitinolytica]|uniref:MHFG family PEP-CTERM protein n=1 Tax=Pseudoduganella chitinolytica TaxID=34070 RepID=A0ABY8BIS4_9BURK|nr:MHFG family PEP-CTERM protein [Pseudoduganella chitinolytica]WEF34164.1 MHFG family PEP-CTERM protein [Pseudoduganella chitinolytica]